MSKLFDGIVKFQKEDFKKHEALFSDLSNQQKPRTLFITCADSRVVPNLITNTLPGELFVVRNIGNLVPPYRETQDYVATTSAIEYAVQVLNVSNIVVCGHSNCGACASIFKSNEELDKLPKVKKWLSLMGNTKEKVLKELPDAGPAACEWLTEQTNVIEQIKHLLTYPYIKEKYLNNELKLFGWYYIIETGEIFNYDQEKETFELISAEMIGS